MLTWDVCFFLFFFCSSFPPLCSTQNIAFPFCSKGLFTDFMNTLSVQLLFPHWQPTASHWLVLPGSLGDVTWLEPHFSFLSPDSHRGRLLGQQCWESRLSMSGKSGFTWRQVGLDAASSVKDMPPPPQNRCKVAFTCLDCEVACLYYTVCETESNRSSSSSTAFSGSHEGSRVDSI